MHNHSENEEDESQNQDESKVEPIQQESKKLDLKKLAFLLEEEDV